MAIRLVVWGLVALGLVMVYFERNPIEFSSEEKKQAGTPLVLLDAESDVLLLVGYANLPSAEAFEDVDFSIAWLNTLQQEIGPVAVADAADFPALDLAKYRIVIVTQSASNAATWRPTLEGFVRRGGILVLEMPDGDLREAFSADGKGGEREPQGITEIKGLDPELFDNLKAIPLYTRLIGSTDALQGAETLMTIDGVPVIYRKKFAKGWAITFDFDYGMLLTSIQQGRPTEGFRIRNQRGSQDIETADMVLDDVLMEVDVPIADALERFILYAVIDPVYPVVGFWPFPKTYEGAFVVTHDEHGLGDETRWMAHYENTFEGRSTYFVDPGGAITDEGLDHLARLGVDIGLLWNTPAGGPAVSERFGLGFFTPLRRELSLFELVQAFEPRNPEGPPLISIRVRDQRWSRDWAWPFRVMVGAGFRIDSSFAPLAGQASYPFGTGLPFRPIDESGLAFTLHEMPSVLVAQGSPDELPILEALLEKSHNRDHQAIGISFSPSAFVNKPSASLYTTWRDMYLLAGKYKHWVTSAANMLRLQLARQRSTLTTSIEKRRNAETDEDLYVLRVNIMAKEDDMSCILPITLRQGRATFVDARRGLVNTRRRRDDDVTALRRMKAELVPSREVNLMGFKRRLIRLQKGFNVIMATYKVTPEP